MTRISAKIGFLGTTAAILLFWSGSASAATCKPEDYGALRDGVHDDTNAIQKAIAACPAGNVVLGAGIYLSGPVVLSSGQTFEVSKGATLLGTANHDAYLDNNGRRVVPLISAADAHDITLTGEGTIDGQGGSWWPEFRAAKAAGTELPLRPKMIVFTRVTNLKVTKLTLQNSPMFHLVPAQSSRVVVDGVTIRAPEDSPNTDGIDPSGRDMLFQNLNIDVGDDNIAIKSGRDDPAHPGAASANMVVRNCTFLHGHGLSIGSETNGGVQNLLAENIMFVGTKSAIRIKTNSDRGGLVQGLTYRNIKMRDVGNAILITDYYPKIPADGDAVPTGSRIPEIYNITIENVAAEGASVAGGIYGLPGKPIHDVKMTNVTIKAKKGFTVRYATVELKGKIEASTGPAVIVETGGTLNQIP